MVEAQAENSFMSARNITLTQGRTRNGIWTYEAPLSSQTKENWDRWSFHISEELMEWARNPTIFEDSSHDVLSSLAVYRAIELAQELQQHNVSVVNRIIATADGGIAFEWWDHNQNMTIEIDDDGAIEYSCYEGDQLVESLSLEVR